MGPRGGIVDRWKLQWGRLSPHRRRFLQLAAVLLVVLAVQAGRELQFAFASAPAAPNDVPRRPRFSRTKQCPVGPPSFDWGRFLREDRQADGDADHRPPAPPNVTARLPCPGKHALASKFLPYSDFRRDVVKLNYAYATFVVNPEYVLGAAVLMHSLAVSGSQYDRVICVTAEVGPSDRALLARLATLVEIERVPSPLNVENKRYKDTFTKLRVWQLVKWKKVVYIDVDVVALQSMDELFDLQELSLPMDAEHDRYSTGMMVIEPSLKTFDDMLQRLQTTQVSMELPDLLFLKEFFDKYYVRTPLIARLNPWSRRVTYPANVNIISRWYQVYAGEFSDKHKTYLTEGQHGISIFDARVHGIHYPGDGKPWFDFGRKMRKFSRRFCDWARAKEFKHEPQFLWYLHYQVMKENLSPSAASTDDPIFEWEAAGDPVSIEELVEIERARLNELWWRQARLVFLVVALGVALGGAIVVGVLRLLERYHGDTSNDVPV